MYNCVICGEPATDERESRPVCNEHRAMIDSEFTIDELIADETAERERTMKYCIGKATRYKQNDIVPSIVVPNGIYSKHKDMRLRGMEFDTYEAALWACEEAAKTNPVGFVVLIIEQNIKRDGTHQQIKEAPPVIDQQGSEEK